MKKIPILLLLFVCVQSGFAQERFVDIKKITTPKGRNLELNLPYYSITKETLLHNKIQ